MHILAFQKIKIKMIKKNFHEVAMSSNSWGGGGGGVKALAEEE